ncbi:MAG: hypothetical protein KC613_09435 [Myxococcales bacterium]|nr:hypothetical protein [Myxococcales bacterium]
MRAALILGVGLLVLGACNDDPPRRISRDARPGPSDALPLSDALPRPDADTVDAGPGDQGAPDLSPLDGAVPDASVADLAAPDLAPPALDLAVPDMAPPELDLAVPDMAEPDLAEPDMAEPDMAEPDLAPPDLGIPGVPPGRTPCDLWGEGWVLWAFHYDAGSRSPRIDTWDATCEYGFQNQACSVYDICRGGIGCEVPRLNDGAVHLSASNYYLQIRFSVAGLAFNRAALFVEARGTRGSGRFNALQPGLGGGFQVEQVDGQAYRWYGMDWSELISPADDPGLTAVRIEPDNSTVAVRSVALCVR